MRLVSLRSGTDTHAGLLLGERVLDLSAAAAARPDWADLPRSVRGILAGGDAVVSSVGAIANAIANDADLEGWLTHKGALAPIDPSRLAAPITDPGLMLTVGMNYHDHLREMNTVAPETPYSFTKNIAAITGPADPIRLPADHPDMVDYEAELVAVIGKACHQVTEAEAAECIGGYMIANDVSARNWSAAVRQQTGIMGPIYAWEMNLLGKQFPTFCPLGPALVTRDEIADPGNLAITTRIDGEVMQSSNTREMIFTPAFLISHYSKFYRFQPGDIILTGTPAGVGAGRKPKRFLAPGEVVEITIEGIGTIRNPVELARRAWAD
jgi:acylpyruvate hydrolase